MIYDLRTYALEPGRGTEFHRIAAEGSVPMLRRHGIEVVAYGASLLDGDRYFLLRAFSSLEQRQQQLDAFYGSDEWLTNYHETVMSMVRGYHVVVIGGAAAFALPVGDLGSSPAAG